MNFIDSIYFHQRIFIFHVIIFQIRRKIKTEEITLKLLEETIQLFPTVLVNYSKILFELLGAFIRDKNVLISNFASGAYRLVEMLQKEFIKMQGFLSRISCNAY